MIGGLSQEVDGITPLTCRQKFPGGDQHLGRFLQSDRIAHRLRTLAQLGNEQLLVADFFFLLVGIDHVGIGSINSPMQCMMKEICAQCLQRHVDPVTGKETLVFSCLNQDQELDHVDFDHLRQRLRPWHREHRAVRDDAKPGDGHRTADLGNDLFEVKPEQRLATGEA